MECFWCCVFFSLSYHLLNTICWTLCWDLCMYFVTWSPWQPYKVAGTIRKAHWGFWGRERFNNFHLTQIISEGPMMCRKSVKIESGLSLKSSPHTSGICCSTTQYSSTQRCCQGGDQASRGGLLVCISHPKTTTWKQTSSLSLLLHKPPARETKRRTCKGRHGSCHGTFWHSATAGGFGRGSNTDITETQNKKRLKGSFSSYPVTSVRQAKGLFPWRVKNGYSTSFSHFCQHFTSQIQKIFFQLKFFFDFSLLLFSSSRKMN